MLETGRHVSFSEIAAAEKSDRGHVGSILRLTLLALDIVEAIMDGRLPPDLGLARLLEPFPLALRPSVKKKVLSSAEHFACGHDAAHRTARQPG
jgi:hypothetical protein